MSSRPARAQARPMQHFIPMLGWLPKYDKAWLSADLIAGLSVWALLVPQSIAYASIAGVPAQHGLYAALAALIGYAVFGTSRQMVTGPSATVAAVSASAVVSLAAAGTDDWVAASAALALTAGVIYIVLGILRLGWIANFLSTAVLGGFIFGFGIGLIIDQSSKILGVEKSGDTYAEILASTISELPQTDTTTLIVGLLAIAMLLVMRRFVPKAPRALIVVVLGIAASALLNMESHGVEVVGQVPTGLPVIAWPNLGLTDLDELALGALAVIFVGFSESLAAARDKASRHDYEIDVSQEMVAQGAANGAAGLLSGFVVDGSLSKTTVADLAGQKTQMASLFNAGFVLLTALLLAGLFSDMPQAVLGAVVIDAAIGLISVKALQRVRQTSLTDFAAFLAAMVGLWFYGVLAGVLIGVVLSLLLLIAAASRSPVRRLALDPVDNVYVDADEHPEALPVPGVAVAELNGPLFFADADNFRQSVRAMAAQDGVVAVVLDLDAASLIDLDGADTLTKLHEELEKRGVEVVLARVGAEHLDLLRRAGTLDAVGESRVYPTVRAAVDAMTRPELVPAGAGQ